MTSEENVSVVTATLNMQTNYSECSLPPEKGSCSESLTRFHYVPELEKCIPFLFSGCKVLRKEVLSTFKLEYFDLNYALIKLSFILYFAGEFQQF